MKKKIISLGTLLSIFCTFFSGCGFVLDLPSIPAVKQRFQTNYNDILTVKEYLCSSEYEDFQIRRGDQSAWADGETIEIEDSEVWGAIQRLLRQYHNIMKSGNTIFLTQWSRFNDVGCGIAYSINGVDEPEIQYLTTLEKMPSTDWYYFVDDYNEWRIQRQNDVK